MGYTNILEEKNRNHQEFVPNDVKIVDKMVLTDGFNHTLNNHVDANNPNHQEDTTRHYVADYFIEDFAIVGPDIS